MKCPKCGNELEEGKLLCENCGEEIKIVPEYDIELEDKLKESISSMANEFAIHSNEDENIELTDDEFNSFFHDKSSKKIVIAIVGIVAVIAVIAVIIVASGNSTDNSFEYQYNKALEYAGEGDYTEAANYLERALAINPDDTDSQFLLAKYYEINGQQQSAVSLLKEILNADNDYSKRDEVYEELLGIYEEQSDFVKMGELLKICDIDEIVSEYNMYAALEPTFNKDGGVYDKVISISIKGNTQGFVYYTTDGTTPTLNSQVYETPIELESGDYVIKAMFVNLFGVESNVVVQNYYINIAVPDAPLVKPDSGTYSSPVMIEAYYSNTTKIYYTTDGSVPDKKCTRYDGPIEMPYGISNFSFITIDDSGVASEVVNRTYHLEIECNFSTDMALTVLRNNLWASGKLSTVDGNVTGKLGLNTYSIRTIYQQDDITYYIVGEEYIDTMNKSHETGNFYAIDVDTCDLYTAYKIDEGKYNIRPFN